MNKKLILISLFFILFFNTACNQKNNQSKEAQQTKFCGGWDTFGEVICACDDKYIKSSCPSGAVCDSGKYTCNGLCGKCMCYKGSADKANEIECDGRDKYFQ